MAVVQWICLLIVLFLGVSIVLQVQMRAREQMEIRREKRSGITPPNGTAPPEYRIPVTWIKTQENSLGRLVKAVEEMQVMLRRMYDDKEG
jgi:hypothetical protein